MNSEQEHDPEQLRPEGRLFYGAAVCRADRDLLSRIEDAEAVARLAMERAYHLAATAKPHDLDLKPRFNHAIDELNAAIDMCLDAYGQLLNRQRNE